jgi:hypothetical protein
MTATTAVLWSESEKLPGSEDLSILFVVTLVGVSFLNQVEDIALKQVE